MHYQSKSGTDYALSEHRWDWLCSSDHRWNWLCIFIPKSYSL